VQLSDFKR